MPTAEVADYIHCLMRNDRVEAPLPELQPGERESCQKYLTAAYLPPDNVSLARPIWIATDAIPAAVESWPLNRDIPTGWHLVSQTEAAMLRTRPPETEQITFRAPADDLVSRVAALSAESDRPSAVSERRPPRPPREPRPPRLAREPRPPREPRPYRFSRPPRPRRVSRKARPPRKPRTPRKPRPSAYKTQAPAGVCKGPACTCWTPGGCVGEWYLKLLPGFETSECYKGPCYSYEQCMSGKCQLHIACAINTILAFWARQYRAVVANPAGILETVTTGLQTVVIDAAARARAAAQVTGLISPPTGAVEYTNGCPPGWHWVIGLTGITCAPPGDVRPPAPENLLRAYGVIP